LSRRPVVVVPGRFSAGATALRYRAVVNARALLEMVYAAGAEPVTVLPWPDAADLSPEQIGERLAFADAVLLPGGGDVDPRTYSETVTSDNVYDVDPVQDHVDLAIATWAFDSGLPLLAICRGLHVVNVALGGTLEQHMAKPHRERVHQVSGAGPWPTGVQAPEAFEVSCYHHQRVAQLAAPLEAICWADDGTVEAVTFPSAPGWFLGVQWHPEDTPHQLEQAGLVRAFVNAAAQE
jgi:putative glutamine amidotransferase